jgi:hypothetical protein
MYPLIYHKPRAIAIESRRIFSAALAFGHILGYNQKKPTGGTNNGK